MSQIMTHRLLLVEQSATMRLVLEKHAVSLGYDVDARESYPQAAASLAQQFQQFGTEYSGLLFGWPTTAQDDAAELALLLENNDHRDLPVVVMSADMRAETLAWVAGRENTAVLAWKGYQGLESTLKELIDTDIAEQSDTDIESGIAAAEVDNQDVQLLVVDDSATIRYSLRDLFQLHGYGVTLAATHEEAMRLATDNRIDIAVLDYYLAETTGDVLCREMLANEHTGDIVCTVLTGTYSDHIIKRSLRAGAVECMFKNESNDLLLSRIDAISRFVRQTRRLQLKQSLLEDVLECTAGAIILLNDEQHIVYINEPALEQLGISEKSLLIGKAGSTLLEAGGPAAQGNAVHAATWSVPDERSVEVDYQHTSIKTNGYSLLRFTQRTVPIVPAATAGLHQSQDPDSLVSSTTRQFELTAESAPFLSQMQTYLENVQSDSDNAESSDLGVSLLVMDVFILGTDNSLVSLVEEQTLASRVRDTLKGMHVLENHVVVLRDNRFGFLIRHAQESQAYQLTRKVMQRCLEIHMQGEEPRLACTASLLSLEKNSAQPVNVLVQHAFHGMDLVNIREPNQAILLDVRRLLSAYPTP